MRPILQVEATECGLASLAMVAGSHGLHLDLPELRRRFPGSLKGARLEQLMRIAQQLGRRCRALRLEVEQLSELTLPCILHWDLNHFVVLAKAGRRKATILDPASGERRLGIAEISRHFTGVALELTPAADFTRRRSPPAIRIRQLTGPIRGLWPALAQAARTVTGTAGLRRAGTFLHAMDSGPGAGFRRPRPAGGARGRFLARAPIAGRHRPAARLGITHLSARLGLQWMGNVFAHLLRLPMDFFEKRHLGDISSRLGSVQAIQKTLTTGFIEAIIDGLMALVTLALMLVYSWKLALVTLLAVALYLGIRMLAYRPLHDRSERQLVADARQQSHLLESLRGMQSLKVAGEEAQRRATWDNLMVETVNQEVRLARMGLGFNAANQLLFGAERIAVITIGALLAMRNAFSVGMLIAYLAYKDQFAQRMASLIDKYIDLRMLRLHAGRLGDIVLAVPEEELPQERLLPVDACIEVEGLCFRHAEDDPWLLRDLSFTVSSQASRWPSSGLPGAARAPC